MFLWSGLWDFLRVRRAFRGRILKVQMERNMESQIRIVSRIVVIQG